MTARFRIRTPGGQEVSFATKEMFENFVRAGDLSPDDLVYDRETGSWSSARTHPAVIDVQYEMETDAGSGEEPAEKPVPSPEGAPKAGSSRKGSKQDPSVEKAGPRKQGASAKKDAPPKKDAPDDSAAAPEEDSPAGSDLDLDLDFELTEAMSPEDSKRIFLEQLEAERRADIDAGDTILDGLSGFTIDSESMGQDLQDRPPASAEQRRRERPASRSDSTRRRPDRRTAPSGPGRPDRRTAPSGPGRPDRRTARSGPKAGGGGGLGRVLRSLVLLAVVAAAGYVAYELLLDGSGSSEDGPEAEAAEVDAASAGLPSPDEAPAEAGTPRAGGVEPDEGGRPLADEAGPAPEDVGVTEDERVSPDGAAATAGGDADPEADDAEGVDEVESGDAGTADTTAAEAAGPEPVIPDTESAVRGRAQERYLAATQRALRDLEPVPDVWPTGPYLSVPSDYPEVVDAWQDYLSTIRAVRPGDQERYRVAYEAALDDAAVTGEARQERLQRALADFSGTDSLRQAHFDRVEALARAALQSHNALVEVEGTILYDATGSTGRQQGIGLGASARDAEARLVLDQVVELLEDALDAGGEGPGSSENVREWVWDGFLDAATR